MATSDLTPVGAEGATSRGLAGGGSVGRSKGRKLWSQIWQYALLVVLAAIVLAPLLLTVRQSLTPPFRWVNAGRPAYPVYIEWKDRTWWTGGAFSVIARTLVVFYLFSLLQRAASSTRGVRWREVLTWRQLLQVTAVGGPLVAGAVLPWFRAQHGDDLRRWRAQFTPARLLGTLGATIVLGVAVGPAFASFHDADGRTQGLVALAMVAVAATQIWGFLDGGHRSPLVAIIQAACTGFGVVGAALVFVGPEVWTRAWGQYDLGPAMGRSLTMAVAITVLQVATSIMAAYAFVFLRFPFKRVLFALFMATLLLPLEVTLVGNIATIRQLEWTNTMQALVLPFGATALGTFLIRQGFRGLPPEIQDATRLDGYGHVSFLARFAVPLTRPVIASFTVISALQAWNQYLWPRAVITENGFNTLQVQLRLVSAGAVAEANEGIAAALVASVPVAVLLIAFQRQIIRGLTAGAVK